MFRPRETTQPARLLEVRSTPGRPGGDDTPCRVGHPRLEYPPEPRAPGQDGRLYDQWRPAHPGANPGLYTLLSRWTDRDAAIAAGRREQFTAFARRFIVSGLVRPTRLTEA